MTERCDNSGKGALCWLPVRVDDHGRRIADCPCGKTVVVLGSNFTIPHHNVPAPADPRPPVWHAHQAQIPTIVYEYFSRFVFESPLDMEHPVITRVFYPDRGWTRYGFNKRISRAWVRNHLVPEGITHLTLSAGGHNVDFAVPEILRSRAA